MSHETGLTKEEQQMEALLGQLLPATSMQSRDKLMFRAGRASAGQIRLWQGVSGVCAVLLVCALSLRSTSTPTNINPTPQWTAQVQPMPSHESSSHVKMDDQAYIRLRSRVLSQGLDALPDMKRGQAVASDHMSYGDALKRLMNM